MSEKVSDDYGSLKPFLFLTKALLIASNVCAVGFILTFIYFLVNISNYNEDVAMIGLYLSIGFLAIGMNAIVLFAICKGLESFVRVSVFKLHEYEYDKEYETEL